MTNDCSRLTDEIVAGNYREIIQNGVPFLQIFPQMFQDENIAETFKLKKSQRNNNLVLLKTIAKVSFFKLPCWVDKELVVHYYYY